MAKSETEGRAATQINWYPGHMAKARRMLQENIKLIDVVVEVLDARAPLATRNPDFDDLFRNKMRVVLLNKADLADPASNKRWLRYFRSQNIAASEIVSTTNNGKQQAVRLIEEAVREKVEQLKQKGIQKTVRVLVVGIPNVGKSTFINRIAGSHRAETGDRPGVTKGKQWVRVTPYLELLDSPGLLWPKLDDQTQAMHLAFIGSINDQILDIEELAWNLLRTLRALAPRELTERYTKLTADTPEEELLDMVAKSRGFILCGGVYDTERAARIVLDEYRGGKIAKVTLEQPMQEEEDGKAE